MIAIRNRSPKTVRLLLEHGADVGIMDDKGEAALDIAQRDNDPQIVDMIKQAIAAQSRATATSQPAPAK
jgi:ankyrin repeat protein